MNIPTAKIRELREQSGAGVISCRNALIEACGDMEKAQRILKEKGILKAQDKSERSTTCGVIETYVHTGGRIGAMIEVNCETDFVARTGEFKDLAHNLVMQVAAMPPKFISDEEIKDEADVEPQTDCLLLQPFIRDPGKTIRDIIVETIAKLGENIKVARFARFELGR
ncbi:MAG: elongation factor Ts [Dehalococcoidales bacterium]|nr:elongation factor Ts [Dehalococcoidales bacterium]